MKLLFLLLLFVSSLGFSQSSGITYQAVIYNPNGEELPRLDNPYSPLTNQNVCLQFGIVDADGNVEYQEEVQVTTDAFGMVNLLIGTNTQTGGSATDFAGIEWSADAKFLKVDLDVRGTCSNFEELSNQPFTYVPFGYYSPASDVPGPVGPMGPQGPRGERGPMGPSGNLQSLAPQPITGVIAGDGLTGGGYEGDVTLSVDFAGFSVVRPFANDYVVGFDQTGEALIRISEIIALVPEGNQGPVGPQGDNGVDGEAGPQGEQGAQGETGAAGQTGPQGESGAAGAQGIQGEMGLTGPTGANGPSGVNGVNGTDGEDGIDGYIGAVGPQGIQGNTGEQGYQGDTGLPGDNGLSAYDVWLGLGNTGTEPDFINSLTGPEGPVVTGTDSQTLYNNGSDWVATSNLTNNGTNVGIGTSSVDASAILQIESTSKGVLFPKMSLEQRNIIPSPQTGLLIFQIDNTPGFYFYDGSSWLALTGSSGSTSGSGGGSDSKTLIYTSDGF